MHRIVTRQARLKIQNVPSVFFLLGNGFSEKNPDLCTSNPGQLIQTHFPVPIRRWVLRV